MIEQIRYKNFKSLRDATLPLGRFTLIVGANGTGKTSAINALNIIIKPTSYSWKEIVSASNVGKDEPIELEIQTETITHKFVWRVDAEQGQEVNRPEDFNSQIRKKSHEIKTENFSDFKVFSFDSDKIAESVSVSPNNELNKNGKGLAGVLDQLRDSEPERFEELNNELNRWFPEYDRILFEVPSEGKKTFLLRTVLGKYRIKAEDLSDGTRLALTYLTISYLPNPPKIVAFEEPERGIHPRLLRNIQEAMYRLAYPENYGEKREPVQVIATTHSPYLLDLYKDYPEEVVIAGKDENGVHFERLIDKPHYEEVLQDAPLGEIWYSGVLGGVPAQI
ncbi:MAG: ATP-binding protein [Pyrinomonadaceae bacterium]|nr:ATP-binding protein [Pyrinomonadaceae bacterium]